MSKAAFGKRDWVEMFEEIGLDDPAMSRWHGMFEQRHPDAHQSFLEWLRIPSGEIEGIRQSSRGHGS